MIQNPETIFITLFMVIILILTIKIIKKVKQDSYLDKATNHEKAFIKFMEENRVKSNS